MSAQSWTREQLIRTLALYRQIPFGKMHARNPLVVALSGEIGRSPSAISMKLGNFASLDPDLRSRGIKGMKNRSNADKRIWDEFHDNWEALAEGAIWIDSRQDTPLAEENAPLGPTEVTREIRARRGQHFFRSAVLAASEMRCCITGISCAALLRASHIIPWSRRPDLRLNPRNGLCLNAIHDAAFDRGYLTVSARLEVCVSRELRETMPPAVYATWFNLYEGKPVILPERCRPSSETLEFHRAHIFRS